MIRRCTDADVAAIHAIVNDAAEKYRGAIPADCWHEPYMSMAALQGELAAGVQFSGWEQDGELRGVMGLQMVKEATLIRHAYVRTTHQGEGIGSRLLTELRDAVGGRVLVGTWAAAEWAIRFYQRHGFELATAGEKDNSLQTYWSIPERQREMSVVLRFDPARPATRL